VIQPMLARLGERTWSEDGWIWEEKFDGIRAIVDTSSHRIQSRSGKDKTAFFPEIRPVTTHPAVLDGELVGESFNSIQHRTTDSLIDWRIDTYPVRYEVFDVISINGNSVEHRPLSARKTMLQNLLIPDKHCAVTKYSYDGEALFQQAVEKGAEGVIGKSLTGVYEQGMRRWTKVKCEQIDHFRICGYTNGTGKRESTFGALIVGKLDSDRLAYVGEVGTGFSEYGAEMLVQKLRELETSECPFLFNPYTDGKQPRWVRPEMQAVVKYLEYTNDFKLRFPAYLGLLEEILR